MSEHDLLARVDRLERMLLAIATLTSESRLTREEHRSAQEEATCIAAEIEAERKGGT